MKEIQGKYNTAVVYAETIGEKTEDQIAELCSQKYIAGSKIRIMPDCHAGRGCVIGTTMTLTDKVCPSLVGCDIGCGMYATMLEEDDVDFAMLDHVIRTYVPSGMTVHDIPVADFDLSDIRADIREEYALQSIGTLGGGNHFIEVDRDTEGRLWLVIHSGSRHLGGEVYNYYQNLAIKERHSVRDESQELIARYKAEGRQKEISAALAELKASAKEHQIPDLLCYVEGQSFDDYMHDIKIVQDFARLNRRTMTEQILYHMDLHAIDSFDTIHNYVDVDSIILRKGSISARSGEKVLIPMNMEYGSLVCTGKGNPEWNYSAPHGAGRVMSRHEARQNVSMDAFTESMKGIWSSSVCEGTIDEAPMVYKNPEEIIRCIEPTVDVVDTFHPVYNFKASE